MKSSSFRVTLDNASLKGLFFSLLVWKSSRTAIHGNARTTMSVARITNCTETYLRVSSGSFVNELKHFVFELHVHVLSSYNKLACLSLSDLCRNVHTRLLFNWRRFGTRYSPSTRICGRPRKRMLGDTRTPTNPVGGGRSPYREPNRSVFYLFEPHPVRESNKNTSGTNTLLCDLTNER